MRNFILLLNILHQAWVVHKRHWEWFIYIYFMHNDQYHEIVPCEIPKKRQNQAESKKMIIFILTPYYGHKM